MPSEGQGYEVLDGNEDAGGHGVRVHGCSILVKDFSASSHVLGLFMRLNFK